MVLWRIVQFRVSGDVTDMSGYGAALYGGRFNSLNNPAVYTATSISLAALETLVHFNTMDLPVLRYLVKIEVPDDIWNARAILNPASLPGWNHIPPTNISTGFGDAWLQSAQSLLLEVPSVIVPEDKNVVVNPKHPDINKLIVTRDRQWDYDRRLIDKVFMG